MQKKSNYKLFKFIIEFINLQAKIQYMRKQYFLSVINNRMKYLMGSILNDIRILHIQEDIQIKNS